MKEYPSVSAGIHVRVGVKSQPWVVFLEAHLSVLTGFSPPPGLELTEYGKLEDPQVPETLSPLPPPSSFLYATAVLRIELRFQRLRAFSQLSQIPSPLCSFFFSFSFTHLLNY